MASITQGKDLPQCDGNEFVTIYCGDCGHKITYPVSCGFRTCPNCRRKAFFRLSQKYLPKLDQIDIEKLALVTLTLRIDADRTLKQQLDRVRDSFGDLRRRLVWADTVSGGLYAIESKWSQKYDAWNVHIHALVEAKAYRKPFKATCSACGGDGCQKCDDEGWYWQADIIGGGSKLSPQELDEVWQDITTDSHITNIMPVMSEKGGKRGAINYILKYLCKRAQVGARAHEYNNAYHGRRVIHPFGTWHSCHNDYRFEEIEQTKQRLECPECGQVGFWISEFELIRLKNAAIPFTSKVPPEQTEQALEEPQALQLSII